MPRPLALILSLLALAAAPAGASAADFGIVDNRASGRFGSVSAQSVKPGSLRLVVERAGVNVLDVSSQYQSVSGRIQTQPGDVVKLFQPADAAAPALAVPVDDKLTIDRVCAGLQQLTGKFSTAPGAGVQSASTVNAASNRSSSGNSGRVTVIAPGVYRADLRRPIEITDTATVVQYAFNAQVNVRTVIHRAAEFCTAPPTPAPTDGLVSFSKKDVKALFDGVQVKLKCSKLSTIDCAGGATLTVGKAKLVGSKAFRIAPGKTKRVTVKLRKAGRAALKKKRRLTVTLTVATKNQAGAILTKSVKVTLKAKRRKR